MCKSMFIQEGPSRQRILLKALKEEEVYFTTLGFGKVTGVITEIDDQHAALIMTLAVRKIGQDVVRGEKKWETHYDPYTRTGMFFYKD